jgi:phage baseplate assembly protein gpV
MINYGTVVDIIDPEKLGRCKVQVYGVHDNIETKDLPWSQVVMPANTPAKGGIGSSVNLLVGTLVCGIFLDGSKQEFIVQGTLPTKTDGVEDNNIRVRAGPDPHAGEPIGEYQPVSTYAPEYPYNNVMETESGHLKEYDDTKGHERIVERHMSGTQYEVCADGTKNERIVRDNYRLVVGQDTLEVFGNVRIIVSGQADIAVAKDVNLAVGGDIQTVVSGNMVSVVSGNSTNTITGTAGITSTGDMTLKSANIKLDGDVVVTGTTTTSETLVLDTHKHSHGDPAGNTSGPTN